MFKYRKDNLSSCVSFLHKIIILNLTCKCKPHVQRHCFRLFNLLFCAVLAAVTVVVAQFS